MTALDLLVLSLATLYAAHAITHTHGAFGMFAWVREHLPLGGLTTCIVCMAIWCAAFFWVLLQTDFRPLCYVFAVAGGAVLAAQYTGMNQ